MKKKNLKPQEKVERFMIKPHYSLLLGVTVTKDTDIEDETEDGRVHQTIKNLVFTTTIKNKYEKDGMKIEEKSKLTINLKEGIRLVWIDNQGYILPDFEPKTTREVLEDMNELKDL